MNPYYIVKHSQGKRSELVRIVERHMAELDIELAARCHEIIERIKTNNSNYCFYDRESLEASNLEHIKKEVFKHAL